MIDRPLTRAEIPTAYTWDLTHIYPDDANWEAEYQRINMTLPELEALRNSFGSSAACFLHALTYRDTIAARIDCLLLYAALRHDEDTTQAEQQARAERAAQLQARFRTSTAFFSPEILALPATTIAQFLNDAPALEKYGFFLSDLQRQQAHVQSAEVETVLAQAQLLAETPLGLFGAIKDADFVAPTIQDEHGSEIAVTHGRYWALLRGTERRVRRDAHQVYIDQFRARQHSLAAALASAIKRDVFLARARKYPSALQAALDADAIPATVYDRLINTVTQHGSLLHRYVQLRQRALGVAPLHFYDLWVPLASSIPPMAYDQARETLFQALTPLGAEYGAKLRYGLLEGRWVDVYETAHKRSGAYSTGAFGVSPYIMLNWQHQLSDLYTLAHEAGHAMHTYFAGATQPYVYSEYSTFVAEVASICNEILLSEHLLTIADQHTTRLYVLSQQLQRIVELLFWQALFAEFDQATHNHAEADQALTAALFSTIIANLQRKYFGNAVQLDDSVSTIWALFPHFYLNFYVYKFATGMIAALALAQQIRSARPLAVERYLTFLRSGSSKSAIDVLGEAGIDMTTAQPFEQAMQVFEQLLDQFEVVLDAVD